MNRLQPVGFYIGLLGFFMAALVAGACYLLFGMNETSYLVSDGVRVGVQYLDKPGYDANLQGFIFSVSFLVAGGLMLMLIIIPDERAMAYMEGRQGPPPPQRRRMGPAPAAAPEAEQEEPHPEAPSDREAEPTPGPAVATQQTPVTIEQVDTEGDASPEPPEIPAGSERSLDEEVLGGGDPGDDLPELDSQDARFEDAGEEDVVYGDGRINEDAIWEFIQSYPDSAVKFLYRKNLDNKPLGPTDEDIYRNWEARGLTRAKVREVVLEIMQWHSLPDSYPHNIWRELRDAIYEMKSR